MARDWILLEKKGPVGYVILNRPEKHNALAFEMFDDLAQAVRDCEDDDAIKVIVIKGNGPSFCSGHDLSQVGLVYGMKPGERRPSQRVRLIFDRKIIKNYEQILFAMKPIITQVHGHCIGGGMMMCYITDLTVAADDAKFGHIEQRLGVGGHLFVQLSAYHTLGAKKVRELMLLNEEFGGQEAVRLGLANKSVPADQLDATVDDWARRIARHPKDGLVMGRVWHQQIIDMMGAGQQLIQGYITHSHMTNLRFDEDEFNFFRNRRDGGATKAIKQREAFYQEEDKAAAAKSAKAAKSVKAGRSGAKPAAKAPARPAAKSAAKSAAKPAAKSATKSAAKPAAKSARK